MMLSEAGIKSAIKSAPASGKQSVELKDGGERGSGRLALSVRVLSNRVVAEWYAVYYRNNKRLMLKIGTYPVVSLAEARKMFREQYAPAISSGADPTSVHTRRRHQRANKDASVKELFEGYVASLRAEGKRCADSVERILLADAGGAASTIGQDRPARSITPEDIVAHLAIIHDRGAVVMAANARAFIGAAFAWGCKAEHDYTAKGATVKWGLSGNPVDAIKFDSAAQRVRNRFLSPAEFRKLWEWTLAYEGCGGTMPAIQLLMLTGQRVEEVLRISTQVYDPASVMLHWDKTKNKLPHTIPISRRAADILDHLMPNRAGFYFPGKLDPMKPMYHTTPNVFIGKFIEDTKVEHFTPRDLRRTFKTLAGDAGISKEMRDRLQNHVKKGEVSTRHYDRYDYLAEKREAVEKWAEYVDLVLGGKINVVGERNNVVPFKPAVVA